MAALGDIAVVVKQKVIVCRATLTLAVQPTGNGPITNTGQGASSPYAIIKVVDPRGADLNIGTRSDGSGIWSIYDLSPGVSYATELAAARTWQIDVAADLSFTVVQLTGFARGRSFAVA